MSDVQMEQTSAQAEVAANFDPNIDYKETIFRFRKTKDEATGVESKRPNLELKLPIPSIEGMIAIFKAGGKGLELMQEAVSEVVISRARELVSENESVSAESFPYDELSWEKIANLPKTERRGAGIAEEQWKAFATDYVAVMPQITGKTVEQVTNATKIFLNKFNQVRTNKPVLKKLNEQLGIYVEHAQNAEQYTDCVEFLSGKAKKLLEVSDEALLANL